MPNTRTWNAEDIKDLPDLCKAQCCTLKVQRPATRVWLCRVDGGVTVEIFDGRQWSHLDGSCCSPEASD